MTSKNSSPVNAELLARSTLTEFRHLGAQLTADGVEAHTDLLTNAIQDMVNEYTRLLEVEFDRAFGNGAEYDDE